MNNVCGIKFAMPSLSMSLKNLNVIAVWVLCVVEKQITIICIKCINAKDLHRIFVNLDPLFTFALLIVRFCPLFPAHHSLPLCSAIASIPRLGSQLMQI